VTWATISRSAHSAQIQPLDSVEKLRRQTQSADFGLQYCGSARSPVVTVLPPGSRDERVEAGTTVSDVSYVNRGEPVDDALLEVGDAPGFSAVAEIPMPGAVSRIAVSPDGARLLVTHYGDNSVSLIDTCDHSIAQTVVDADEPFAIAIADAHGACAYVSTVSAAYDSILAFDVDNKRVIAAHPVAHSVTDLAVSPDGKNVYASRTAVNGADVMVLNTETGTDDAIGIAAAPGTTTECVRVSPDGSRLYVAANGPSCAELVVVDVQQRRVANTIEIGSPIRDIALSPDGATAYVASCGPDFGAVLDVVDTGTHSITSTCKVGEITGFITQLVLGGDGKRAYLVGDESVTVLSTLTHDVVGAIVVGPQPSCVVESPDGNRLYVADYAGMVTVLAIAPPAASADMSTSDDEPTIPHQWAMRDLLQLESTPT
jgi:YVTN family beta-propeller protein